MSDCLPCDLETAQPSDVIFRDNTWSCEIAEGYDVPGWFILRLRRHAEGWAELTSDEVAGFGAASQRLAGAIQAATVAPTVYFMSFGENFPHFHFLVIARDADLPPESRGGAILARRLDHRDLDASREVGDRVRSALTATPL